MQQMNLPIKTKIAAWWMIVIAWIMIFPTIFYFYTFFFGLSTAASPMQPDNLVLALITLFIFLTFRIYGHQILKGKKRAWKIAIVILLITAFLVFGLAIFRYRHAITIMDFFESIYYNSGLYIIAFLIPLILLLVDRKNFWRISS